MATKVIGTGAPRMLTVRFRPCEFDVLLDELDHQRAVVTEAAASIALLANNFDVMWVMRQVGHADSKMTTDVYAQLQQRAQRQHGEAFDALVRRARERLYGTGGDPGEAPESHATRTRKGTRRPESRLEDVVDDWREEAERP